MWSDFFTTTAIVATLASAVRFATPFLLAALGETIGQRSGVLNLGVEGVMLLGAFSAYYVRLNPSGWGWAGGLVTALAVALAVGVLMGLLYAWVTLVMHAEQGISGIGVYLFGLGFTDLLFQKLVGTPRSMPGMGAWKIPGLGDLPWVGDILFNHTPIVYLAYLLVPLATWMIARTTFGLNIRAVGETPEAADTLGVSVNGVRLRAILIGNGLAALAGAAIVMNTNIFQQNLTAGQGFIAVALVYFGAWRPAGAMAGALLFGVISSTVLQLKTLGIVTGAASALTAMAPALLTIIVLVIVSRRIGQPSALTRPFDRHA